MASMMAAVGASGSSISSSVAAMTSRRLCGGTMQAMPTAMPSVPLTRRLGYGDGSTAGSTSAPS